MRVFLPVGLAIFLAGVGYGLFRIFVLGGLWPNIGHAYHNVGVVFMVGLVAEQVAQLRYDRSKNRD